MASKYTIEKFKAPHFSLMQFNPRGAEMLEAFKPEQLAKIHQNNGPAFTAFYCERPIAIGGLAILWPGNAEGWALFGPSWRDHKFFIHRTVKKMLPELVREYKIKRLQACAAEDHKAGCAWLEALGFKTEGKMPFYFGEQTFIRFARIF